MINLGNAKFLSILLPALILAAAAYAAAWDSSWGFEGRVSMRVTYTQSDAARYLSYIEATKEKNTLDSQASLEAYAARDADRIARGEHPAALYNALPSAGAIPREEALCIAYAYVEQTCQTPESLFLYLMPTVRFQANRNDPEHNIWGISFHLSAEGRSDPAYAPFDHFFLSIDAATGTVVNCMGASVPAAG